MSKVFPTKKDWLAILPENISGDFSALKKGEAGVDSVSGLSLRVGGRGLGGGNVHLWAGEIVELISDDDILRPIKFREHVSRFMNSELTEKERLSNWALGLAGEVGEVVEPIKKHLYHGKPLDKQHLVEEVGGVLWYLQALAIELGFELEDAMKFNQEQLEARHQGQSFKKELVDNGKASAAVYQYAKTPNLSDAELCGAAVTESGFKFPPREWPPKQYFPGADWSRTGHYYA